MEDTFLVANSNLMELMSPRMDLSLAKQQFDKVDNKCFESP